MVCALVFVPGFAQDSHEQWRWLRNSTVLLLRNSTVLPNLSKRANAENEENEKTQHLLFFFPCLLLYSSRGNCIGPDASLPCCTACCDTRHLETRPPNNRQIKQNMSHQNKNKHKKTPCNSISHINGVRHFLQSDLHAGISVYVAIVEHAKKRGWWQSVENVIQILVFGLLGLLSLFLAFFDPALG